MIVLYTASARPGYVYWLIRKGPYVQRGWFGKPSVPRRPLISQMKHCHRAWTHAMSERWLFIESQL